MLMTLFAGQHEGSLFEMRYAWGVYHTMATFNQRPCNLDCQYPGWHRRNWSRHKDLATNRQGVIRMHLCLDHAGRRMYQIKV